jgi:hypothetical protein
MRKAVVARRHSLRLLGIIGVCLLAGCQQEQPTASLARALGEARFNCENTHGVEDNTPEMDECMLEIVPQSERYVPRPRNHTRNVPDPLTAIRATCLNRYGHSPDTPELAQCVQQLDLERQRQIQEGWQALGQTLSSMAPSTTSCNTTYGGGFARTNCY